MSLYKKTAKCAWELNRLRKISLQASAVAIIALTLFTVWELVIIPDREKISDTYSMDREYSGQNQVVDDVYGELGSPFLLRDSLDQHIVKKNGDELTISSVVSSKKASNDEPLFRVDNTFKIDAKTRMHLDRDGKLFAFPQDVEKKDYDFFHPEIFMNDPMAYKGTDNIHGLDVYRFEVETKGADISFAFPQYAPHTIHTNTVSKLWVEPTTGNVISFEKSWDNYLVENGQRVNTVEAGGKKTSEFTERIMVQTTKSQIENIHIYRVLIPILILVVSGVTGLVWILSSHSGAMKQERKQSEVKNKLKDELVSMLSHEIKNPLTPILSVCEMLLLNKEGNLNEKQREKLQVILRNSKILDELLSDFVEVKKFDLKEVKLSKTEVDLKEYLGSVIESVRPFIGDKNVQLSLDLEKTWKISCDQKRISQVISNLVKNAIDFVPEGNGKIIVSAKKEPIGTIISIQDNGIGISAENAEIIFDKFSQLPNSAHVTRKGSGLGLAVCKGIVEAHGGTIWLDKKYGDGSRFQFLIPQ